MMFYELIALNFMKIVAIIFLYFRYRKRKYLFLATFISLILSIVTDLVNMDWGFDYNPEQIATTAFFSIVMNLVWIYFLDLGLHFIAQESDIVNKLVLIVSFSCLGNFLTIVYPLVNSTVTISYYFMGLINLIGITLAVLHYILLLKQSYKSFVFSGDSKFHFILTISAIIVIAVGQFYFPNFEVFINTLESVGLIIYLLLVLFVVFSIFSFFQNHFYFLALLSNILFCFSIFIHIRDIHYFIYSLSLSYYEAL